MRAYIVIDLGFGDSGKGLLTDFLVRRLHANVIVRYNGGAQAGHNVVTSDGRHHTFSQFGSGTFIPGVRTYLSRHVVIHPTALLLEGDALQKFGIYDSFSRIRISDQSLVITPFHQAVNRIREILRGANRHGSCGVGVGETVEDATAVPEQSILAGDLNQPETLRKKLKIIREYKLEQITSLCKFIPSRTQLEKEYSLFERQDLIDLWISSISRIGQLNLIVSDAVLESWLHEAEHVVFEGAQGVLLDADAGFHPYTTWSRCTAANAIELVNEIIPNSQIARIGVMRAYAVRHGPGPFPTETSDLNSLISEHNRYGEWQGNVRYGWFDAVMARYAMNVTDGVDLVALTHLDSVSRMRDWKYCQGYEENQFSENSLLNADFSNKILTNFHVDKSISLDQRINLTKTLLSATPVIDSCPADEQSVIATVESLIGHSVDIVSRGPMAQQVQELHSIPG